VVFGSQRVDEACFVAGPAEFGNDGSMILAGPFDGDDEVLELVLLDGLAQALQGGLEVAAAVRQVGGWDEQAAIEIGDQVARGGLATINGHDAKALRADLLDAVTELAVGFLEQKALARLTRSACTQTRHSILLSVWKERTFLQQKGRMEGKKEIFLS